MFIHFPNSFKATFRILIEWLQIKEFLFVSHSLMVKIIKSKDD